jgi:hypothetical protein
MSSSSEDRFASVRQAAGHTAFVGLKKLGSGLAWAGSAAARAASTAAALVEGGEREKRERVLWAKLDYLEWEHDPQGGQQRRIPVLLQAYESGFQIWSLETGSPEELVSRRDGAVR